MKNYFLTLLAAGSLSGFAQSSLLVTNHNTSVTIAPNSDVLLTTAASSNTQITIDIKNTGNSVKEYNVKRYDIVLNTVLSTSTEAEAYFCFAGNCYGSMVMVSPTSLTLNPGQSASQVSGSYQMLVADLDEASSVGFSHVKYTFINVNTPSDSVQINLKYNNNSQSVGIKETNKASFLFAVYPNPAKGNTIFKINSAKAFEGKLTLYNALGEAVYQRTASIDEGVTAMVINVDSLPSGIYFADLKNGDGTLFMKKFIIN